MGLLIAPYNTAMRLGQGFNSYTQEICIDDAVIIDPGRPCNQLTNDGSTMIDLREAMKGGLPYTPIKDLSPTERELLGISAPADTVHGPEPLIGEPGTEETGGNPDGNPKASPPIDTDEEPDVEVKPTSPVPGSDEELDEGEGVRVPFKKPADHSDSEPEAAKKASARKSLPSKSKEDAAALRKKEAIAKKREADDKAQRADRAAAKKAAAKRQQEADDRARKAANGVVPYTRADRDALHGALQQKVDQAETQTAASLLKTTKMRQYERKSTGARGPSQVVTYSSSFIDKLSEVTDDMNISGALSIKYGTIGGSGRGAFVNSEKFKDSDLNFYISVKVVNQTINIKDALVYQPLRTVDSQNFREVYGDAFISGFVEGGEFNAIVSMKVHNKAQIMNIEAEAKVALTVGVADISAEAAVKVAKKNISNNTETTIMVSWSGGGFIKPIDEPWDIESLMSAAARFPDLVAITPQRTYAILTKYETLRSFVKLKPAAFSPMGYEVAQMYTNNLLDVFMDYKNLHKKIGQWMFDVENKISKLVANPAWRAGRKGKKSTKSDTDDDEEEEDDEVASTRRVVSNKPGGRAGTVSKVGAVQNIPQFRVSLGGLDEAKKACRIQMMRIVNEVDAITKDPSLATDESRVEPFLPFRVFKELMPVVERIVLPPAVPLRLEQLQPVSERLYPLLCPDFGELEEAERVSITNLERERPTISRFFRLAKPVGSSTTGTPFNNVDFLRYDTYVTAVHVEVYNGVVSYIETTYSNGLVARHGGKYDPNSTTVHTLQNLGLHERIIAATVETGVVGDPASSGNGQDKDLVQKPSQSRITRLKLYTNRGRSLVAEQAPRVAADQAPRVLDDTDIKPTDMRGRRHFNELTVTHFDPAMDDCYFKGFWGCSKNGLNGALEDGIWRLGVIWGNNLIPEVPISEEDLVDDETKPESGKKDKKVVKK